MPRGAGNFSRVVAGLLALVLLVLPGPAMRHASAATLVQQAVAAHCVSQSDGATLRQAAPVHATLEHAVASTDASGQPCGRPGGDQGLPCCVAAQCPFAASALLYAQAGPQPSFGAVVRYLAPADARFGIEIPPSLPPPKLAA